MKRTMLIALSVLLLAFAACSKPKPKKEPRIEIVTVVTLRNGEEIEVNKLRYPVGIFSDTFKLETDFGVVEVPKNFAGVDTVEFLSVKSRRELIDELDKTPSSGVSDTDKKEAGIPQLDSSSNNRLLLSSSLVSIVFDALSYDENGLTPLYLSKVVSPYLSTISDLQEMIYEIKGVKGKSIYIKSITQNSPISISLQGGAEAIEVIKNTIVPWRRKHVEKLARIQVKEKLAEIEIKKAEVSEKQARAAKDQSEAEKIAAEAMKYRQEAEKMKLENEKLQLEIYNAQIQLSTLTNLE